MTNAQLNALEVAYTLLGTLQTVLEDDFPQLRARAQELQQAVFSEIADEDVRRLTRTGSS